ncbi:MAG TPA: hypothetical protein VKZ53_15735 [Candidatus Angelobacter sp.]|nr:hypothetical protein [Candidatus Angelobacter sp.]
MTLRERRIENEWLILSELAKSNPEIVPSVERTSDAFTVQLQDSPAWMPRPNGDADNPRIGTADGNVSDGNTKGGKIKDGQIKAKHSARTAERGGNAPEEYAGPVIRTSHSVRYHFPAYFPHLPIEAYIAAPVFHPNVDPRNGFACLWLKHDPANTIVDAIVITRELMAHRTRNANPQHVMQRDALQLCRPLSLPPLKIFCSSAVEPSSDSLQAD